MFELHFDTWASLLSLSDRWSIPSTWSDLGPCWRTSACPSRWWSALDTPRRTSAALSTTAWLRARGTRWLQPSRRHRRSWAGPRSPAADAPGRVGGADFRETLSPSEEETEIKRQNRKEGVFQMTHCTQLVWQLCAVRAKWYRLCHWSWHGAAVIWFSSTVKCKTLFFVPQVHDRD